MSKRTMVVLIVVISIFILSSVVLAMGRKVKPAEQPPSLGTAQPEIELVKPEQLEPNPPITAEMKERKPQELAVQLAPDVTAKNKQIQAALKNAGYDPGAIDGKLGPRSKKAIKDFQAVNGLKADGKVGAKTWAKLSAYVLQANTDNTAAAPETNFEKGTAKKGGR